MTSWRRTLARSADLRLRAFAALFAVGVLAHELEFALEQEQVGPLSAYLESWRRAIPTVDWSSQTGLALHAANIGLSVVAAILPWPRVPLCLLAITFFLSQVASPDRTPSHSSLIAGGLLVVTALTLLQGVDRLARGRERSSKTDWERWILAGLAGIATLVYFFAFFYKLNPNWFSPRSQAPAFLIQPVAGLLNAAGVSAESYRPVLAAAAIYGTLAMELALPALLLWPRTQILGCFGGLLFHLPMIAQGVTDFPALMLAFYPAFLTQDNLRALLARSFARPPAGRVAATLVVGATGAWTVLHAPKLGTLALNSAVPGSILSLVNAAVTGATFVIFAYLALVLGGWLLERRSAAAAGSPNALAADRSDPRLGPAPGSLHMAAAGAAVVVIWIAFAYNNFAPFFGLPSAGAMVMYSGTSANFNNHALMPRHYLHDSFTYTEVVRFDAGDVTSSEANDFRIFVGWLHAQRWPPQVLVNVIRYQMDRICRATPGATVTLTLRTHGVPDTRLDVCAQASMRKYTVISEGSRCLGPCDLMFRRWAQGRLPPLSAIQLYLDNPTRS